MNSADQGKKKKKKLKSGNELSDKIFFVNNCILGKD